MRRTLMGAFGLMVLTPLEQAPLTAPGGLHNTAPRTDVGGDWPEGDLPEQMGGEFKLLQPGIDVFRLPTNLAQLFSLKAYEDQNPRSKTKGQQVERLVLKLDRSNPLVIVSGPRMGDVLTGTITSNPRARGKKDNPQTVYVSDLAYLLEVSLGDKSRPTGNTALMQTLARYAGKDVRLEHGLSGFCNPEHVVKLPYQNPVAGQPDVIAEDPQGRKGCGKRYYTSAFKSPAPADVQHLYDGDLQCSNVIPNPADGGATQIECGAIVRGFAQIEKFLPPLGQ